MKLDGIKQKTRVITRIGAGFWATLDFLIHVLGGEYGNPIAFRGKGLRPLSANSRRNMLRGNHAHLFGTLQVIKMKVILITV